MLNPATAIFALFLGTSTAWAGKGPEVAVVGAHIEGLTDEQALAAAEALAVSIDSTGHLTAVTPGEVRGRLAGREPLVLEGAFMGPGRKALEEGRVLYQRADFESAIPILEDAVDELIDGLSGAPESRDLIDALLLLGLAQAGIGETDGARAAYKRVVVLDPARELDPVNYPPKIVNLYDEVRTQVLELPSCKLQITARDDAEAEVYIDGKKQGTVPVNLADLPPGWHYLTVIGSKGRRTFEAIKLEPGSKIGFEAGLDQQYITEAGATREERSRQIGQLYGSLGTHVATPLVLLAGQTGSDSVGLQLYEPRTGNYSKLVRGEAGDDPIAAMTDLMPALASYINESGALRTDRVSPEVAPLDVVSNRLLGSILLDPEPIVEVVTVTQGQPWYVWAGVSAVAVGAGTTAALLLGPGNIVGPGEDPNQGTIIVGPLP